MPASSPWVTDDRLALFTDLYQLTMLRAYYEENMTGDATFSLFVRRLPESRNFLLACGIDDVLHYLENLHFDEEDRAYLARFDEFSDDFLDWLGELRFSGDVRAVPEGTPVFPDEPILEVTAPIAEAQVAETFIMNQVHMQTVLASKAARIVRAARGRPVIDFGARRMHGTDAAIKGARAFHVAGLAGTSNVLAGDFYDVAVTGTVAHSFIQACEDELEAFRIFTRVYPDTVLLIDTYDTIEGARNVVRLAKELGEDFRVRAVRLDSGDLAELAKEVRDILDEAGLEDVEIFASSGLDEWKIDDILEKNAPIDGFGVGTNMGVARDAPGLDIAYKLCEYGGEGRLKLSTGKPILPGRKQVFRMEKDGRASHDVIGRMDDDVDGRPLLRPVMRQGRRVDEDDADIDAARERAAREIDALPDPVRGLDDADPAYRVDLSDALESLQRSVTEKAEERH